METSPPVGRVGGSLLGRAASVGQPLLAEEGSPGSVQRVMTRLYPELCPISSVGECTQLRTSSAVP